MTRMPLPSPFPLLPSFGPAKERHSPLPLASVRPTPPALLRRRRRRRQRRAPAAPMYSHQAASSTGAGRARSRVQGARTSRSGGAGAVCADQVGEFSGFPLIPCPDCGLARVVEGKTKKEGENHNRLYFKCQRNGNPKLCDFYKFEKQYFEVLKRLGIILVRPSNWEDLGLEFVEGEALEDEVDSPGGAQAVGNVFAARKGVREAVLEKKMERLIWQMDMFVVCVVSVVVGCVLMYAVMK